MISVDGARRDLEAQLAKANKDRPAAEVECDALYRDKECLTINVKPLDQEAAQRARPRRAGILDPRQRGRPTARRLR